MVRSLSRGLATAGVCALLGGMAPHALAVDATFGCRSSGIATTYLMPAYGQTYTFTVETNRPVGTDEGCRQVFIYNDDAISYSAVDDLGNALTLNSGFGTSLTAGRTYTFTVIAPSSGTGELLSLSLNNQVTPLHGDVIRLRLPDSSVNALGEPPVVLQQTGVPTSGKCSDVDDSDLRFLGFAGGWSKSWAHWMNEGSGGPVCTRTLVYSADVSGYRAIR